MALPIIKMKNGGNYVGEWLNGKILLIYIIY